MGDIRKQFPGSAVPATLAGSMTDTAVTVDISTTAGWPTGGNPWVVTLNRGGANEEQVLVRSRTGATLTFTLADRGYGGTVAVAHAAGETIECSVDPVTLDWANFVATLLTVKGQVFVFNGTNLQAFGPLALDEVLAGDPGTGSGLKAVSRLVPLASAAPAYLAGGTYFDTTRFELMVGQGGTWKSASPGAVVCATTAARDTLFGAAGPAGRLAYVTADTRIYVGTGTGWYALPLPGEYVVAYGNEAAVFASTLAVGSLARAQDTNRLYIRRTAGWIALAGPTTISASAPASPVIGDIWAKPVS